MRETSGLLSRDLPSVHGISISSTMKRQRLADSFLDQITSPENLPSRDGVFPSRSDLFSFLNSFAASRGFAFVIGDAYNRTTRQCVCHKTPTPHIAPVYKTSQRGTGCTYRGREDEMGMWHLHYPIEPNLDRNHDFTGLSTIYPTLRRLSEQQKELVESLNEAGFTPSEILRALKASSVVAGPCEAHTKDIANFLYRKRQREGGGVPAPQTKSKKSRKST